MSGVVQVIEMARRLALSVEPRTIYKHIKYKRVESEYLYNPTSYRGHCTHLTKSSR